MSHSRSRSASRGKDYRNGGRYSRSRSRSRGRYSRSASRDDEGGYRIHVADIGSEVTERMLEDIFVAFGPLAEIWVARYPPYFAFAVFKNRKDADDAVRDINGTYIGNSRVRVSFARPRRRGPRPPPFRQSYNDPPPRSRNYYPRGGRRSRSRSRSPRRRYSRSRSRSYSPKRRNYSRSRSRSRGERVRRSRS